MNEIWDTILQKIGFALQTVKAWHNPISPELNAKYMFPKELGCAEKERGARLQNR